MITIAHIVNQAHSHPEDSASMIAAALLVAGALLILRSIARG